MNKLLQLIIKIFDDIKVKINDMEIEKQQLAGKVIENKVDKLNLSETFDLSRIRYDFGIKIKNDSLVKVKCESLTIDQEGNLYFLDKDNKEELKIGDVEEYLYEYDIYKQEWKKADIVRMLGTTNFTIKGNKQLKINKAILENNDLELYSNIN